MQLYEQKFIREFNCLSDKDDAKTLSATCILNWQNRSGVRVGWGGHGGCAPSLLLQSLAFLQSLWGTKNFVNGS